MKQIIHNLIDFFFQHYSLQHVQSKNCILSEDYWPHSGDVLSLRYICDETETERTVLMFQNTGT